jgi:membrane-bound serine protease (ClpP class)
MDTEVPGFEIARSVIGAVAFAGAMLAVLIATYFARSRRRPVITGADQLLHERAVALGDFSRSGRVQIRGEIWNAVSRVPVTAGQSLRVLRVDGLTLEVEPAPPDADQMPRLP